jgi:Cys-tRNA(Pro)/Cys-tRNA(Cys) deacylase
MSTRAIKILKKARVPIKVITYVHKEKGAAFAAQAIGFTLERTIKTLIVDLGDRRYVAALLPGNKKLDVKKLARVYRVKLAAMADVPTAERLTGYIVGGISPFGTKRQLDYVMDRSVLDYATIAINAGKRGVMLQMAPQDILASLPCQVADIGRKTRHRCGG